ncbi:hypothetical protein ABZY93_22350 [Streptomyces smyrnaeus]|uniref:hypothetical protein n=1 Tax=Streptomyces smyrnaeus TaxID=1387713 RepID=UPI0033BE5545
MKYLKLSVSSPYANTERTIYAEVPDEYDTTKNKADYDDAQDQLEQVIWEYVEAYFDVVDASEVPEYERP